MKEIFGASDVQDRFRDMIFDAQVSYAVKTASEARGLCISEILDKKSKAKHCHDCY